MVKVGKFIEKFVAVLSALFILWLFLSWAEVVAKNMKPNPTYSEYNAFVLFVENSEQ